MKKEASRKRVTLKGMVRILATAVIIPAFLLSIVLYRSFYREYYENVLTTNETILEAVSVPIEDNEKIVENIIELLSYDGTVTGLLKKKERAYSKVVQQVFEIQELIAEREVLLAYLGGDIVIFSDDESIPESYWYLLGSGSAEEMEGYRQFIASGETDGWTGEELMYPGSTVVSQDNRQTKLSYYRLITDSISGRLGFIKCGVEKSRFLEALSAAEVDGDLFVLLGGQVIYGEAKEGEDLIPALESDIGRQDMDGIIYITHPIRTLNMNIVVALDKQRIMWKAMIYALPQLLIILGTGVLMLTASGRFTRIIYRRIDQVIDVARQAKDSYMDVTLPNSDDDDISALIDALNALIEQIRSRTRALVEHEQREKNALRLAFQYQMNPHFLFNTLNWMQMCIELGAESEKISEGIVLLGRLLRYNLNGETYAPVSQEIDSVRAYVRLMNMRKNDAVFLSIDDSGVEPGQRLLRFMLQPLCENAIQHGLAPGQRIHIHISVRKEGDCFWVAVKNDGTMIEPEQIGEIMDRIRNRQGETGVGLANLYARIKLLYGDSSDLIIESGGGETSITLKLKESKV